MIHNSMVLSVLSCASSLVGAILLRPALQQGGPAKGPGNESVQYATVQGRGGELKATIERKQPCTTNVYKPSRLEKRFKGQPSTFFFDEEAVCDTMGNASSKWILQNHGLEDADADIFSEICKKGHSPQYIEPLAGILRDPRFPSCKKNITMSETFELVYSIDWLVMADGQSTVPGGKKRFFDAGCTHFSDALLFFVTQYEKRGIIFDEIYAWEAREQPYASFWTGIPPRVRQFWEPRLRFHNGVPVSGVLGAEHNPVEKIHRLCGPLDFCAFKLDIDTPEVELALVQQLLGNPQQTHASLSEFFFEHHVRGIMENYGWFHNVSGDFPGSYKIFTELRKLGVRAHSWV